MIGAMQDDQRFSQGGGIARVEGGVPLLVLIAKAHHDHIGVGDTLAGADGIDHRALVVVPVLVGFRPKDGDAAIVTGRMIGDRGIERDIKTLRAIDDLLTPIGVDFA